MWYDPDIVGYDELLIASGVGSPAESTDDLAEDRGIFVLIGNCCGFIPFNTTIPADFRVVSEPSKGALYIDRAFSLKGEATCRVRLISPETAARLMLILSFWKIDMVLWMMTGRRKPCTS